MATAGDHQVCEENELLLKKGYFCGREDVSPHFLVGRNERDVSNCQLQEAREKSGI